MKLRALRRASPCIQARRVVERAQGLVVDGGEDVARLQAELREDRALGDVVEAKAIRPERGVERDGGRAEVGECRVDLMAADREGRCSCRAARGGGREGACGVDLRVWAG